MRIARCPKLDAQCLQLAAHEKTQGNRANPKNKRTNLNSVSQIPFEFSKLFPLLNVA